jgi:hypothetical protein
VESDKVNLMELPFVVPVISWRDGSVHNCVTMTFRFGPVLMLAMLPSKNG